MISRLSLGEELMSFFLFSSYSPSSGLKTEVLKQKGIYDGSILPVVSQNAALGMSETWLSLQLGSEDALKGGNTMCVHIEMF